jgi:hypothetical protein
MASEEPEVEGLLRAVVERRLVPVPVELPALPEWATPAMRDVAGFFELVRGVRIWAGDGRDVPFACGWVAEKLGRPKKTVHRALRQLEACGVLEKAGSLPGRGKRGTQLWAPGVLPAAPVRVERRAGGVGDSREPELHLADEPHVGGAVVDRQRGGWLGASMCGASLHDPNRRTATRRYSGGERS